MPASRVRATVRTILSLAGDLARSEPCVAYPTLGRKPVSKKTARPVHGAPGEATSRRRSDADDARRPVVIYRLASSAQARESSDTDALASSRFSVVWRWKSIPRRRPPAALQRLITEMASASRTWGKKRIASEPLVKLGITYRRGRYVDICRRVRRVMVRD